MAISTRPLTIGQDGRRYPAAIVKSLPRRKRILFVDHTAAMSGGEIALFNLVRHLDRTRYEPIVLLFANGPLRDEFEHAGIRTHCLQLDERVAGTRRTSLDHRAILRWGEAAALAGFVYKVARLMRKLDVDLVHTNSLKADIIGGIAGRLANRPVLWHVRDRIADDYLPGPAASAFRMLARLLPRYVVANSKATLATLEGASATERGEGRIGRLRRRVVHDGVSTHDFRPSAPHACGDRPIVGLVGRISPWKGQDVFVRAASSVLERIPNARFRIVGAALFDEREYEAEVRSLVDSLGLSDSVEFTGFRSDVAAMVSELDLLVHASTVGEPFGQVIIEGMAAGKPVVATDGGGVPEIVEHEATGLLVPMRDADAMAAAICRILIAPEVGRAMGILGRRRIEASFTIEQVAQRIETLYDEILAATGSERSVRVLATE